MPTLISAAEFRERFDISSDIDSNRIQPHIGSASRRLRKWVGEELYLQALDPANNETTDADLVNDLKNAEAHLTFHFAIFGFNSPLTSKGVVATSMSGEGKEMRKYLTPDETSKLSSYYLELAREIVEPYALSDGTPTTSFDLIDTCGEYTEASTRPYGRDRC